MFTANMDPGLFIINSKDRTTGTSSSFVLQLNDQNRKLRNVKRVVLKSVILPNTIYNIRSGVNNIVSWTRSTARIFVIPPGAYSLSILLSTIQTGMNAVADGNTYSVTSSPATNFVTFTTTAGNLNWFLDYTAAYFPATELGYLSTITFAPFNPTTSIGNSWPNLSAPYHVGIKIEEFGSKEVVGTNINFRSTFVVPVNVTSGNLIQYYADQILRQDFTFPTPKDIDSLSVSLWLDTQNREAVDLNGVEWTMVWELHF